MTKSWLRRMLTAAVAFVILFAAVFAGAVPAEAADAESFEGIVYTNDRTGYVVRIEDGAGLISDQNRQAVIDAMIPVTEYGSAGFSTKTDSRDTEIAIRELYRDWFGTDSGTLFMIDMGSRNIWIHSDGAVYKTVTQEWADVITDNTYRLAKAGQYGNCAVQVFEQITTRLEGGRVNNGLKIGTGLLIAFLVSMLVNYLLILHLRNKRSTPEILGPLLGATAVFALTDAVRRKTASSKKRVPRSSGGGSSGGGFSGGGGGGGGSSGGGGGHGF